MKKMIISVDEIKTEDELQAMFEERGSTSSIKNSDIDWSEENE